MGFEIITAPPSKIKVTNSDVTKTTNAQLQSELGKTVDALQQLDEAIQGVYARRNLVINPNFGCNQRGYASGTATVGAAQYTLDMWRVVVSGESLTYTGLGGGAPNFPRQVVAPAGGIEQVVPGSDLIGGTYVLSWTGTGTAKVNGAAVANGGTVALVAGADAVLWFTGTVSYIQLELGQKATPFEHITFAENLRRCQRYVVQETVVQARSAGGIGTATYAFPAIALPSTMHDLPTITVVGSPTYSGCSNLGAVVDSERWFRFYVDAAASTEFGVTVTYCASCEP